MATVPTGCFAPVEDIVVGDDLVVLAHENWGRDAGIGFVEAFSTGWGNCVSVRLSTHFVGDVLDLTHVSFVIGKFHRGRPWLAIVRR